MTPALDQYLNEDPILKRMVDQELKEKDQQITLLNEELNYLKSLIFHKM